LQNSLPNYLTQANQSHQNEAVDSENNILSLVTNIELFTVVMLLASFTYFQDLIMSSFDVPDNISFAFGIF
jgi:hypothetical protein